MQVAYLADSLYQTPAAHGVWHTVELARESADFLDMGLRRQTLSRKMQYLLRHFASAVYTPRTVLTTGQDASLWHLLGLTHSTSSAPRPRGLGCVCMQCICDAEVERVCATRCVLLGKNTQVKGHQ